MMSAVILCCLSPSVCRFLFQPEKVFTYLTCPQPGAQCTATYKNMAYNWCIPTLKQISIDSHKVWQQLCSVLTG